MKIILKRTGMNLFIVKKNVKGTYYKPIGINNLKWLANLYLKEYNQTFIIETIGLSRANIAYIINCFRATGKYKISIKKLPSSKDKNLLRFVIYIKLA